MSTITIVVDLPRTRCKSCRVGGPLLARYVTGDDNPNGNAGRPYLKCRICDGFVTFTDDRGIKDENSDCHCGFPSRQQVAGRDKGRKLHFVCSNGECDFYEQGTDEEGGTATLTERWLRRLRGFIFEVLLGWACLAAEPGKQVTGTEGT